jgi:hypothetical protein
MSSARFQRVKSVDLVTPAWMAGIQVCRDVSGDIRVDWIPALHAGMKQSEAVV